MRPPRLSLRDLLTMLPESRVRTTAATFTDMGADSADLSLHFVIEAIARTEGLTAPALLAHLPMDELTCVAMRIGENPGHSPANLLSRLLQYF